MSNEDKVRKALEAAEGINDSARADVIRLLKEMLPPEQQLYFQQPVLVRFNGFEWFPRYFSHMDGEVFHCFEMGRTSRTATKTTKTTSWKYCKPDLKAESLPNWIDHDGGECPVDPNVIVYVIYNSGTTHSGVAEGRYWKDVVKYFVIPLPKY